MNPSIKSNNKQTVCWAGQLGYVFKQYIERQIKAELRRLWDMIQCGQRFPGVEESRQTSLLSLDTFPF